jgi:hypothetical protein
MPDPLKLEILAYAPTAFFQCRHCELVLSQAGFSRGIRSDQFLTGLPDDRHREYAAVSSWVARLVEAHGNRISVEVIDVASLRGFWKSLRHRIHRYPAVIVSGCETFTGTDLAGAEAAVARHLSTDALA